MSRLTRLHRRPARAAAAGAALLVLTAVLAAPAPAAAAGFLPTLEEHPFSYVRVVTTDGRVIEGRVSGQRTGLRGLKRITVVDETGAKHRLTGQEIRQVIVPLDADQRNALMEEATTSIEKAIKTDYETIFETGEMIYDSIAWPEPDNRLLLQRVNPGFDTLIQVYGLPLSKEWTFGGGDRPAWFGDEAKSYLVVKRGGRPVRIEKDEYRRQFEALFADCPPLLEGTPREERKFRNFADHVYAYELSCR